MRKWLCGMMAVGFLFCTAHAQEDAAKKDLARLQGVWQCVSMEVDGKSGPEELIKGLKVTFKGDKGSHPGRDGKMEEATVHLDPSRKPKEIDMTPLTGPGKGKTMHGIYALEGDTLKICGAKEGGARPTEFKAGKDAVLMVLTREKP